MAVSGTWQQRARHDYTGATRWGDGYNPIHAVRDNGRGRVVGARETLLPLGEPSDAVNDQLTGREIDWVCEDYVEGGIPGEHFSYQDDYPRWDQVTPEFRDRSTSPAMGEQPSWGVYHDSDPSDIWPLPGPTGGMQSWLDNSHGEVEEQRRAIAVPTPFVSGGWLAKQRGAVAVPESTQEPAQDRFWWTINTGGVQGPGVRSLDNDRAVARGTDAPRTSILSRTAGMMEKAYGRSFGMGGGPGTPDMQPFQQSAGLKRPFLTRTAGLPPEEDHFFNTMEGRVPIQRYTTPDPYQGDPEVGADDAPAATGEWGY
jgi:hypothetical protein